MRLFTWAIAMTLAVGCASQQSGTHRHVASKHEDRTIAVTLALDVDGTSAYVKVSDADLTLVQDAKEVYLELIDADGSAESYPMNIASMGAPGRSETTTVTVSARVSQGRFTAARSIVVHVLQADSEMVYPARVSKPDALLDQASPAEAMSSQTDTAALALIPSYQQHPDSTIRFTVRAVRRRIVDSEYLPSSEQLRIRIINRKGQIVWSSNEGLAFLTMIYPVEPQIVGGIHDYTLDWNARTTSGDPIPPGTYTMEITIPAKPIPYSTSFTINFPLQ